MNFGAFHPITVHYPVVLFTLAAVLDLYSYFFDNKRTYAVAHWLILFGTLFMIPTLITGVLAANAFDGSNPYVVLHKALAFLTFTTAVINTILRSFWMYKAPLLSLKYTVQFSILTVLLIVLTGDVGGVITHGKSPFLWASQSHEAVNYYDLNSRETRSFQPNQLEEYLIKQVDMGTVAALFDHNHCIKCHQQYFENGWPVNFSKAIDGKPAWLPRNAENQLIEWEQSPFYKVVIQQNRMPFDENKSPIGLNWGDRLTLLYWLKNNAPTGLPETKPAEDEIDEDHSEAKN